MDKRNHRTIEYASLTNDPDVRNRRNMLYVPLHSSYPYMAYSTQKNPPAPPRDILRDKIAALKIEFDEAMKREGI